MKRKILFFVVLLFFKLSIYPLFATPRLIFENNEFLESRFKKIHAFIEKNDWNQVLEEYLSLLDAKKRSLLVEVSPNQYRHLSLAVIEEMKWLMNDQPAFKALLEKRFYQNQEWKRDLHILRTTWDDALFQELSQKILEKPYLALGAAGAEGYLFILGRLFERGSVRDAETLCLILSILKEHGGGNHSLQIQEIERVLKNRFQSHRLFESRWTDIYFPFEIEISKEFKISLKYLFEDKTLAIEFNGDDRLFLFQFSFPMTEAPLFFMHFLPNEYELKDHLLTLRGPFYEIKIDLLRRYLKEARILNQDPAPYLSAIQSPDKGVRISGARGLSENATLIRKEASDLFIRLALHDPDENMRIEARGALLKMWDHDIEKRLSEALSNRNSQVRASALRALHPQAESTLSHILHAFKDESADVREAAVWRLRKFRLEETNSFLIELLLDKSAIVRSAAASVLGEMKAVEAVDPLIALFLGDSEAYVKETAEWALTMMEDVDISPHLFFLFHGDVIQRRNSAFVLGALRSKEAFPALLDLLKDEAPEVRAASAWALGKIGMKEAISALASYAADPEGEVRKRVAESLGELKGEDAYQLLLPLLNDKDPEVRAMAARGIGEVKIRKGEDHLIPLLDDADPSVCFEAIYALGELRSAKGAPFLLKRLQEDSSESIKAHAVWALGRIGDWETVGELVQYLIEHPGSSAAYYGIRALKNFGVKKIFENVKPYLESKDPLMRYGAVRLLGELKWGEGTFFLESLIEDPDIHVREAVALSLGKIGGPFVPDILFRMLSDSVPVVRFQVLEAFNMIRNPKTIPYLISALSDPDFGVRIRASEILDCFIFDPRVRSALQEFKETH